MDEAALDKLISDIQAYLRDSDQQEPAGHPAPPAQERAPEGVPPGLGTRSMARSARVARLLEVCAYGWAACLVMLLSALLWFAPPREVGGIAQILILGVFGVFTTLALIGGAHRISTLLRIERNTREILRLRRRQNALLSRLVDRS